MYNELLLVCVYTCAFFTIENLEVCYRTTINEPKLTFRRAKINRYMKVNFTRFYFKYISTKGMDLNHNC